MNRWAPSCLSIALVACGGSATGGVPLDGGTDTGTGSSGGFGGTSTGGTGGATGGAGGTDCGPTPLGFTGTCKPGAPPECCSNQLPVTTKAGGLAPNWSCIGVGAGGSGGNGGTGTGQNVFRVEDFQNDTAVPDVEVALYAGDSIVGQTPFHTGFVKGPEHPGPVQLDLGELLFSHPGTPSLSYHAKTIPGVSKDVYGFGLDAPPAPATVVGSTLSPTLFEQLANFAVPIVGWTLPADLAMVTGPILDCDGNDVGGALVQFVDEATNQPIVPGTCERDLRYIYFDASFPNPKCAYTHAANAMFVLANAEANASGPTAGKKLRVELWGRLLSTNAAPVKFAERSVDLFPGTLNIHVLRPNVQQ